MNRRILLALLAAAPVAAHAQSEGGIAIEAPWTRAAGQGGQGAGYLTIRNAGPPTGCSPPAPPPPPGWSCTTWSATAR
jgi:copper(I)-binding protein